jgi:hypothetical protein
MIVMVCTIICAVAAAIPLLTSAVRWANRRIKAARAEKAQLVAAVAAGNAKIEALQQHLDEALTRIAAISPPTKPTLPCASCPLGPKTA